MAHVLTGKEYETLMNNLLNAQNKLRSLHGLRVNDGSDVVHIGEILKIIDDTLALMDKASQKNLLDVIFDIHPKIRDY